MSSRNRSNRIVNNGEDDVDEDGIAGWRAAYRKANYIEDDPNAPLLLREFWQAIAECRREDAIRILDELQKE